MSQREIIYLSFGSFSNHISTHFWNQQQSYFTYENSDLPSGSSSHDQNTDSNDEPLIDHDVSFQAGQTLTGQDTYNPRAIVFETEQEFGSLSKLNALYDSFPDKFGERNVALDSLQSWGKEAHMIVAERVRTSKYQRRLELEDQGLDPGSSDEDDEDVQDSVNSMDLEYTHTASQNMPRPRRTKRVHRFWSDYSRTFFHPRSLVSVGGELMSPMPGSYNSADQPASSDGRARFESFSQGSEQFDQLESQREVLDTNIRWFAEATDLLQGFQYSIDTSDAFGGLGSKYLENLADEFPKVTHLVFGAGWGNTQDVPEDEGREAAWENRLARIRRMNNLLSLVQFMEFSTVVSPLRVPKWEGDTQVGASWRRYLGRVDLNDMHHAAALVSAHLETATLGTRMKSRSETLSSLTSRLNWRKDTKLVHLGGALPLPYPNPLSFASLSNSHSSVDPVDALLQSYGYGDRDSRARQRGVPLESESDLAARGAKLALSSWLDLSLPSTLSDGEKTRKKLLYNLSKPFSHTAVLRNSDLEEARLGLGMLDSILSNIREPFGQGIYIPQSYNVLSSFPNFFTQLDGSGKADTTANVDATNAKVTRPKDVPMLSSLVATPSSLYLLREARETVREALKGHAPLATFGMEGEGSRDQLKETREQIEGWIDAYGVDNDGGSEGEDENAMGTDEEYNVDQKEEDELNWDM
ncbi:related to DML1 - essential protein involved in mtDNA inheritance [Melanopsichium pennsylvanicum]|uniref:Related to DML1 - essential protein involved in mtDNA inheritance n=2 Tax=Melanopsichium pennsylvanicum TaxID=63383 RepID=A0AAJ4XQG6_9BASI|nr:related to DML1 - essential protein involved in mtDNA inheritance [Melanopsichium pennsylvanicum]